MDLRQYVRLPSCRRNVTKICQQKLLDTRIFCKQLCTNGILIVQSFSICLAELLELFERSRLSIKIKNNLSELNFMRNTQTLGELNFTLTSLTRNDSDTCKRNGSTTVQDTETSRILASRNLELRIEHTLHCGGFEATAVAMPPSCFSPL